MICSLMKRSLLLSDVFPPRTGGSGRWFWELYRRLPRDEFRIVAGACDGCEQFDQASDLEIQRLNLQVPGWGIGNPRALFNYVRLFNQLGHIIRKDKISCLHVGRLLPEGWLAWMIYQRWGLPYLCFVHGEELLFESREFGWMMRRVFGRAELVIANSKNTCNLISDDWGVPRSKIAVVHPGVDTRYYQVANRDAKLRQQLQWSDRRVVVSVGRLQKRKGHDVMIRAIAKIREEVPDVLFAICGDGEEREALQAQVDELGLHEHVQFRGEIDDVELLQCYQQADLFVLANRTVGKDIEGFGIVLLEAQSCGIPVIAGDSGGTSETMQVGKTGYIVNCDAEHELARVVAELLLDDRTRQEMGQSARRWVVDQFDWQAVADQTYQVFSRMGQEKGTAAVYSK